MSTATLTPAYGRDYKSKAEAIEAWEDGQDFILNDFASMFDGKPCNHADLSEAGEYDFVNIRYAKLRRVVRVKL